MIPVDFHCHSIFSHCGMHTVVELLTYAQKLGMHGLAITDHGPELHDCRLTQPFFERLIDPVDGIKLLKGVEANLRGTDGDIDFPKKLLPWTDLVLLGIHYNTPNGLGGKRYTELLVTALKRYPYIDIITHPHDMTYDLDFNELAKAAAQHGALLELNNSKTMLKQVPDEVTEQLLNACIKHDCKIAVNSDAHALREVGRDDDVTPILQKVKFPQELIVNRNAESAYTFVAERRFRKADAIKK